MILGQPTGNWTQLGKAIAPAVSGVYVIRTANARPVGRLRGASDLIYIGQGNLRARLKAHTRGWLLGLIHTAVGGLEVAFARSPDPRRDEITLLFRYLTDHLELPPANNSRTLTNSQKADLSLLRLAPQSTSEQREWLLREFSKGTFAGKK